MHTVINVQKKEFLRLVERFLQRNKENKYINIINKINKFCYVCWKCLNAISLLSIKTSAII